jgi:hypothetical protein
MLLCLLLVKSLTDWNVTVVFVTQGRCARGDDEKAWIHGNISDRISSVGVKMPRGITALDRISHDKGLHVKKSRILQKISIYRVESHVSAVTVNSNLSLLE